MYCSVRQSDTADHGVARELFPETHRDGLPKAPACQPCNRIKSDLERKLTALLRQDAAFSVWHLRFYEALNLAGEDEQGAIVPIHVCGLTGPPEARQMVDQLKDVRPAHGRAT